MTMSIKMTITENCDESLKGNLDNDQQRNKLEEMETICQLIKRKRSTKRKRPIVKNVQNLSDFKTTITLSEAQKSIEDRINTHQKGVWLFKRPVPFEYTISFSEKAIKAPLLKKVPKELKGQVLKIFSLINQYMEIGSPTMTSYDINNLTIPKMIIEICFKNSDLRDEYYMLIMKQMNGNMIEKSVLKGLMLIAMGMIAFVPSSALEMFFMFLIGSCIREDLENITEIRKEINEFATFCIKRYKRLSIIGLKRGLAPTSDELKYLLDEVKNPSAFGNTLKDVYSLQESLANKKNLLLPWFLPQLTNMIINLGGERTEGIFRVPGDVDEVNALKLSINKDNLLTSIRDPNVPGSLLKLWFRELTDPIIPQKLYEECISSYNDCKKSVQIVDKLPDDNKIIMYFIINFLQKFLDADTVKSTRMNAENISMVWSPNFIRCPHSDPMKILEMNQKEKAFIGNLLIHLQTKMVENDFKNMS